MLHFHPSSKREEEREKKEETVKRERVQLVIELAKEGRSQREIAKMSGTSQSTVCRILRDPDKALAHGKQRQIKQKRIKQEKKNPIPNKEEMMKRKNQQRR